MIFLRCTDPFPAVIKELERLDALLVTELRKANQDIGARVSGDAKRIIASEINAVPIPLTRGADAKLGANSKRRTSTTKGKHGQWSRTGNLLRAESFALGIEGQGAVSVTLHNNANYSAARSALGGPNPPNAAGRKAGEQRPQSDVPVAQRSKTKAVGNWQERAVQINRDWITRRYEQAIAKALESVAR